MSVTLDGRLLTEGDHADYTFDASNASITFGPQSIPPSGSVVIAEFERSQDDYRRTLAGTSWGWTSASRKSSNRLEWSWEADDPDAPLFGELTAAQRSVLANDADGRVAVPAYEYRGVNDGDYDLNVTANGDSAFVYVGPGNGQWRVGFEYVGVSKGRYRHLAESAYEYVGPGNGSFEPVSTLGAPRSLMTVGEAYRFEGTSLGSFQGSVYGMAVDPNRLGGNTTRWLSSHHAGWSARPFDRRGLDNLRIDWWHTDAAIESGRSADDVVRFANAWKLRDTQFDSSRSEYQLAASTSSGRPVATSIESAFLQSGDLDAIRWDARTELRPLRSVRLQAGWDERRMRSAMQHGRGTDRLWGYLSSARWGHEGLSFTLRWREQHLRDSARVFDQQPEYLSDKSAELGVRRVRLTYRWRDSFDTLGVRQRLREVEVAAPLDWHPAISGDLSVARGEEAIAASEFHPYYRGRLDGSWRPASTATVHAELDLAYTRTGSEREVYLPTRPGQGQYRLERGEYVPDAHGDFRRVVGRSDDVQVSSYDGHQILSLLWRPTIRQWRWSFESRRDRLGRHDPNQFKPLTWLAPWTAADWASAPGARAERHDFHRIGVRPDTHTEVAVDYTADRTVFGIDAVRDRRDRFGATLKRHMTTMLFVEMSMELEQRRRDGGLATTVDADGTTQRLTLGGRAHRRIDWSLEGRRRIDHDHDADNAVRLLGLRPRLQASMGPLNVLLETDATWVNAETRLRTLSALLAEGRPAGFSLVEFCEVRWQLPGQVSLRSRFHADVREHEHDRWRWDVSTVARF